MKADVGIIRYGWGGGGFEGGSDGGNLRRKE